MKKKFYYASLAFAGIIGMSACSKEENVAVAEKQIVDELTIKIDGSTASRAADGTSTPTGNESHIDNVALFVKTGDNAQGDNAKYKRYVLGQGQKQLTVQFAEAGAPVYAVANGYLGEVARSPFVSGDPYDDIKTPDQPASVTVFDTDEIGKISKEYVGTLDNQSYFLMSGKANVKTGKEQETLVVPMKRDLAKVTFNLNSVKGAQIEDAEAYYRPKQTGLRGIVIKRSSQNVQQFLVNGSSESGYELDMRLGLYKEDYPTKLNSEEKFNKWDEQIASVLNKINTTQEDGESGQTSTDYTFAYKWDGKTNNSNFVFNDFYVLPNYAQTKKNSTVIILATEVEKSSDNSTSWADEPSVSGVRYYKARISGGLDAFATEKNKHYIVNATLNGPGKGTVEEAMREDTENDLYISLQVQDWGLVVSNQDIQ